MAKKKNEISIRSSAAEYLTYVASVGGQEDSIEMRYEDENIWLTQKMMATLYDVDVRTISDHIKKVYSDSELEESATIRKFRIVQTEGSRQVQREVNHYNLQMIIAVGFKVNNERAYAACQRCVYSHAACVYIARSVLVGHSCLSRFAQKDFKITFATWK